MSSIKIFSGSSRASLLGLLATLALNAEGCGDPECTLCNPKPGPAEAGTTASTVGPDTAAGEAAAPDTASPRAQDRVDAFAHMAEAFTTRQADATREAHQRVHGDLIGYIRTQLRSLQLHQIEVEHDGIKATARPEVTQARIEYLRNLKALFEAKASLV
jgi:hypothetical protein